MRSKFKKAQITVEHKKNLTKFLTTDNIHTTTVEHSTMCFADDQTTFRFPTSKAWADRKSIRPGHYTHARARTHKHTHTQDTERHPEFSFTRSLVIPTVVL